jgi:hypothetical protein
METPYIPTTCESSTTDRPPFDHALSARLDVIISALDDAPPAVRRWCLRLYKRILERNVPRWPKGVQA